MVAIPQEAAIDADVALEQLYAGHYHSLVRVAVLLLRDQGLAEDAVQDSFVSVHRHWDRVDPVTAPAYLRRAVVNRCRSVQRHHAVADRHRPEPLPTEAPADEAALRSEQRALVLDALAALPGRQREVLVLRYYLDLSEAEIAATLGISKGAVKTHASRGAAALRRILEEDS